jgi:hypothetical protein
MSILQLLKRCYMEANKHRETGDIHATAEKL